MGGFNTQVFLNLAIPTFKGPNWDDILHVAALQSTRDPVNVFSASNGPADRSNWPEQRTIRVWSVQVANGGGVASGATVVLNDATGSVQIYSLYFGLTAVNAVASQRGNPLATYLLPAGDVIKATAIDSGPVDSSRIGGVVLFTAEIPASVGQTDFNDLSNCAVVAGEWITANGAWYSYGPATVASYPEARNIRLWKVAFATDNGGASEAIRSALFDLTTGVVIFYAVNTGTPASSTSFLTGKQLAEYVLPVGNVLQSGAYPFSVAATQRLAIAYGFSAEP